jgi:hypothetical protein
MSKSPLVCRVVIVFFRFLSGIFQMIDLHLVAQFVSHLLCFFCQLIGGKGFHDLGGMVKRAYLAGKQEPVLAAFMFDLQPAFFNIDIGGGYWVLRFISNFQLSENSLIP